MSLLVLAYIATINRLHTSTISWLSCWNWGKASPTNNTPTNTSYSQGCVSTQSRCNTKQERSLLLRVYKHRITELSYGNLKCVLCKMLCYSKSIQKIPSYRPLIFMVIICHVSDRVQNKLPWPSVCIACNHVLTSLVIQTFISAAEVASFGDTRFPVFWDGLQTFHLHSSSVRHFPGIKGVTGLLGL